MEHFKKHRLQNDGKHLFLSLMMSILPFLSFAQKDKSYRHHDIDVGFAAEIPDNFKTESHDGYIDHSISASNFRVSYAYSIFKKLAVGVYCALYSEQESLSGHGESDYNSLMKELKKVGITNPWSYVVEGLDWNGAKTLLNEYQRDFGKYYNKDGSENFAHNNRIAVVPFVRAFWFRKVFAVNKWPNHIINFDMYSSAGFGMCAIVSGDKCTKNEKTTASVYYLVPVCVEFGIDNIKVFGELGGPLSFGLRIGF